MTTAAPASIARVIVDHDLPHLNHPFEYLIPANLRGQVRVGSLVKVRLGRQKLRGWVVETNSHSQFAGKLRELESLEIRVPLFDEKHLRTYQYLAERNAANLSQVFSLALPGVTKSIEREVLAETPPSELPTASQSKSVLRAVRTVLPGERENLWRELLAQVEQAGSSAIVVVPTARDVEIVSSEIRALFSRERDRQVGGELSAQASGLGLGAQTGSGQDTQDLLGESPGEVVALEESVVCLHPQLKPRERYRLHLQALLGRVRLVVGTRSAVWLPLRNLEIIVVWDDADDRLREQRFPRVDALDVAVARSFNEKVQVTFAAYSRSLKAQQLVESGWATDLTGSRETVRAHCPHVNIFDRSDAEFEGTTGKMLLPNRAFKVIREGLTSGAVLCQVAAAGGVKWVRCQNCGQESHCPVCGGAITAPADYNQWTCANGHTQMLACAECGGGKFRAGQTGAERISEELAAAFPDIPVLTSASTATMLRQVEATPCLVVATPGAEPYVAGGYAAVVITEATANAFSSEFGAELEASRRFFNALALARSHAPCLVVGEVPSTLARAFALWDPTIPAKADIADRRELGFFPAKWVVAVDGAASVVTEYVAKALGGDGGREERGERGQDSLFELLTDIPVLAESNKAKSGLPKSITPLVESLEKIGEFPLADQELRVLLRCAPSEALPLMNGLRKLTEARSQQGMPYPKVEANPVQMLPEMQPADS